MGRYMNKYCTPGPVLGQTVSTPPWYKHGCTIPHADNYDPNAHEDDGSCIVGGCMNPAADNYDPLATYDNGTCSIGGCMDPAASNYNPSATYDNGSCFYGLPVTSNIVCHLDAEAINPSDITQVNSNNDVILWVGSNGATNGVGVGNYAGSAQYNASDSLMNNKPYIHYSLGSSFSTYHKVTHTQSPVNEMTIFTVAKFDLGSQHLSVPVTALEGYGAYQASSLHINYAGEIGYLHQVDSSRWYAPAQNLRVDGTTNGINIASSPRHLIGVRTSPTNPTADVATADVTNEVITTLDRGPLTSANWSAMVHGVLGSPGVYGAPSGPPSKSTNPLVSGTGKITSAGHATSTEFRTRGYFYYSPQVQFIGNIYEILIYNRALSDSEYLNVQTYLASKYGL